MEYCLLWLASNFFSISYINDPNLIDNYSYYNNSDKTNNSKLLIENNYIKNIKKYQNIDYEIELSDIKLVDSLVTTDRGEGGFGSTGK